VCTKQGHDVRDFALVAGGGAGGIHAAAIARQLSIPTVIVPRVAALMSAFGMFAKDLGLEYARSCFRSQDRLSFEEVNGLYADMRRQAREDFARIGIPEADLALQASVEMRYADQFHEVEVDLPAAERMDAGALGALLAAFHAKYEKIYSYSMPWRAAEFLTFRLRATVPRRALRMAEEAPAGRGEPVPRGARACLFGGGAKRVDTPVYDWAQLRPGHALQGPALVDDPTTTVLVPPGATCSVDPQRNLVLRTA